MIVDSQNDKKNKVQLVKFRIDEIDKKQIQEQAQKVGKSVSEYCRISALEKQILSLSDEEKNKLRGLSRNLNQALVFLYSEPSNAHNNEQLISEVRKSLNFLSKLRKKW